MAWFKRNKTPSTALPELDWYSKVEKQERSKLAWLLAVASIAAACALLIGLFFGGRWLYRHNKASNKPTTVQTQPTNGTVKPDETVNTPDTTPTPSPTPATTPAPAASNTQADLTNTGPAGTVSIFLAVTLLSVLVYQLKLRAQS